MEEKPLYGSPFVQESLPAPQTVRCAWKLKFLKAVLLLGFIGIALRLVQIQIVDAATYQQIAQRQYEAKVVIPAVRGDIYDRNGIVLASNSVFVSFAADPLLISSRPGLREKIASRFSQVFQRPEQYYRDKLAGQSRFVWLERHVPPHVAGQLQKMTLAGVIALREPKRLYHYPEIGGALIGFTDVDNAGLSGIELQFDEQLRGTDGYMILQRDGRGQTRPTTDYLRVEPRNGNSVLLTIDLVYQSLAEQKLKKGVEATKAQSGLVVMMAPATGEILATVQYPPLDPTSPASSQSHHQRLRAVTDMFEPGSVFKIVTASAALESKLVRSSQQFNAEQGTYTVKLPDGRVRVIRDTREHNVLTFQQAMEFSSNIVMAKVSDLIGADRLYTKARAFGFGSKSGIEYPGEVTGDLKRPVTWSGTTLNTMAYGYEVGVTPIQIISAYAAVANDGILMKPMLFSKIVTGTGEVVEERKPEQIRRVISPEIAATIKQFLEGVVQRGTGVAARMENLRIGGKTGTSRKYAGGQYHMGSYTASFVGFFPLEHPEIVCLVMLDNPDASVYTGGAAAAPIFREIVEQIVATGRTIVPVHDNIIVKRNSEISVPDVTGLRLDVARKILEGAGLGVQTFGDGIVIKQSPRAGSLIERNAAVTLVLNNGAHVVSTDEVIVPNVCGMSLRRAVNRLAVDKLKATVHGSGLVVDQMPEPGSAVSAGTAVVLVGQSRNTTERVLAEKNPTDE